MKFIFPGPPISRIAHKNGTKNGRSYCYDAQIETMRANKDLLKKMILNKKALYFSELTDLACAIAFEVEVTFYLSFPVKLGKRKIKDIVSGLAPNIANTTPDCDNMLKFYGDVANGILYKDDKQIISLNSRKYYDMIPRTEFNIMPVGVRYET